MPSEQLRQWNQRGCKGHRLYNQSDPCIALAKLVEINRTIVFHPFTETIPPKQWPPWPVQDAADRERTIWGYSAWGQIEGGHLVDS
jgi:hypothetical protein